MGQVCISIERKPSKGSEATVMKVGKERGREVLLSVVGFYKVHFLALGLFEKLLTGSIM